MNLILLGAPGAGKGTQADRICAKYQIPTISTGNLIRAAVKGETELGKEVRSYIEVGLLVPDDVVIAIVKERLAEEDCKNGFILDGFPRTIPQAESLDRMGVRIDKVLEIYVSDESIVNRMSGRRICEACGASYHIEFYPTKEEDVCDICKGRVITRTDDHPDIVKARLAVYHEQTEPVKSYYAAQGKLCTVVGQEDIDDTTALVMKALEA